ncbi:MAG: ClC family H(+)/Cl(-) exchange transporter [Treponema sp.]|jgi:H+/Cl- antiporter ClcA|nr:ClC family H(+)/Cl(-) exchange transporter [Treponema sp.]
MLKHQKKLPALLRRYYASRLALILESILIGLVTGFVIVLFRYLLSLGDEMRQALYGVLDSSGNYRTVLWCLGLIPAGLLLGFCAKKFPMIRGSGIPQIKGALSGLCSLNWAKELPLKFITGVLGLGLGLSLGREGPSIQIGAYTGKGVLAVFRRPQRDVKRLITAASAAGVAAAFNAPLAGVIFALEELQSGFQAGLIACCMGAAMAADAVAGYFFSMRPIFNFGYIDALPLRSFPWIILLGLICGILGDLFKRSLYLSQDLYAKLRIPDVIRPVLPLLVSVPLSFFLFDVTGGGYALIESLSQTGRPLQLLLILLAGKIMFTALCYGSGTSGGIFLPLLACGALAGNALGLVLFRTGYIASGEILNFTILGMAAFFTGAVNAPVTGVTLILEMSGSFRHLSSLVLICLCAFVTSLVIKSRPVYEVLLKRFLRSLSQRKAEQ